jgi:transcriptional regulator
VYIPQAFRETRPDALQELIRQNSFGVMISHGAAGMIASHLPLLLDPERGPHGTLLGHMARANPQWQEFQDEAEVLVIFSGPHAYISPSWYQAPTSVPTWNYAAVHAYGVPSLVEESAALYGIVEAMVRTFEAPLAEPWTLPPPEGFVAPLLKAIVGFEIRITRLEGKLKLGQNRSRADQQGVVEALIRQDEPLGLQIAQLMRATEAPGDASPSAAGILTTDD